MGYEYKSTPAERKAAALLLRKGWRVIEPSCPLCHGTGFLPVFTAKTWDGDDYLTHSYATTDCPNGCPTLSWYVSMTGAGTGNTVKPL